jgi:hypothetical protein
LNKFLVRGYSLKKEKIYMTKHLSLSVNDSPIEMDYFVQSFIDHTVYGMVSSLKGIKDIHEIEIKIKGKITEIFVNNDLVPLNDFVAGIISSTVRGMISPLKDIEKTEIIRIVIQR